MDFAALARGRCVSCDRWLLLATERSAFTAGGAVAGRIIATAGPVGTRAESRLYPNRDERHARNAGGGPGSSATSGKSHLRSRAIQLDFPGQQYAGAARAEGL